MRQVVLRCCRRTSSAGVAQTPAVLHIAASQIAEVAGLNRYVKKSEAEEHFLQRNKHLAERLGRQVAPRFRTRVEAAVHALPAPVLAAVAESQQLEATAPAATVSAALQQSVVAPSVAQERESDSHEEVQRLTSASPVLGAVAAELITDVRLQRGAALEAGALDSLSQPVRERNAVLHSKVWFAHAGYDVVVRGKVDGISADGRIVETKNRSRRLFGLIPQYEKVQLCAYMWLLEGQCTSGAEQQPPVAVDTSRCTHVENCDGLALEKEFHFDPELWATCEEQAKAFVDELLAGGDAVGVRKRPTPELIGDSASVALPNSPSKQEAYRLFMNHGLSVEAVATEKAIQPGTVVGYLLDAQASGLPVELQRLPELSESCVEAVRAASAAVAEQGGDPLSINEIRARLAHGAAAGAPTTPTYTDVRLFLARGGRSA
jgi:hypothetical protein